MSEKAGRLVVGEIDIKSIDCDGVMQNHFTFLSQIITDSIDMPITALGGAGSFEDISSLVQRL
jgi:cyclase